MKGELPPLYLAPMVRISTLPFRLMALKYGATKVFTPEIIDKAIINSIKVLDPSTGIISFRSPETNGIVWSTHPCEKDYLVFQLGSADPELAVKAFKKVKDHIFEINLNAGCPKRFSIQAGMGAALLKRPDLLISILNRLGEECSVLSDDNPLPMPLSVKLRLITANYGEISSLCINNLYEDSFDPFLDTKGCNSAVPLNGSQFNLGFESHSAYKKGLTWNGNLNNENFNCDSFNCKQHPHDNKELENGMVRSPFSVRNDCTSSDTASSISVKENVSNYNNKENVISELAISSSLFYNMLVENCPNLNYIIIHSRRIPDRSEKVPAFWGVWNYLLANTKISLIANGDFLQPTSIQFFWEAYKIFPMLKGLMVARGAQCNPSIFLPFSNTPSEMLDVFDVCRYFLSLSKQFSYSSFTHIKFAILQMLPKPVEKYAIGTTVLHATSWEALLSAFAN